MILVIDKTKAKAACLSDSFINMGLPSMAATPKDALSRISSLYRAVIITSPETLADAEDLVRRLRTYMQSVPVFALCDKAFHGACCFDRVFDKGCYAAVLLEGVNDYCQREGLPIPGSYLLAGIDASVDLSLPRYFFDTLPFTKTEALMLRVLIRAYPMPMRAEDIIEHVYRPGRAPDPSNTRTHVSLMNKKFRELTGRNLIQTEFKSGYRILTPELITL